jgi:hypothetical protein
MATDTKALQEARAILATLSHARQNGHRGIVIVYENKRDQWAGEHLKAILDELDAARAELDRLRGLVREYAEAWDAARAQERGGITPAEINALQALYSAGKEIAK